MAKYVQFADDPAHRWRLEDDADLESLTKQVAAAFLAHNTKVALPLSLFGGGNVVINVGRVNHVSFFEESDSVDVY